MPYLHHLPSPGWLTAGPSPSSAAAAADLHPQASRFTLAGMNRYHLLLINRRALQAEGVGA